MYNTFKKYIPSILLIIIASICVSNLFVTGDSESVGLIFPKLISIILLICGVLLGLRTFAKERLKDKKTDAVAASKEKIYLPLLFVLIGYILLMNVIGFFISTLFFLYACCRTFRIKWLYCFIFSVIATGIIYVLFIQVLFVPFPEGVWIFKDFSNLIMY